MVTPIESVSLSGLRDTPFCVQVMYTIIMICIFITLFASFRS